MQNKQEPALQERLTIRHVSRLKNERGTTMRQTRSVCVCDKERIHLFRHNPSFCEEEDPTQEAEETEIIEVKKFQIAQVRDKDPSRGVACWSSKIGGHPEALLFSETKDCEDWTEYLEEEARVNAWQNHKEIHRTNGTYQDGQLKFFRLRQRHSTPGTGQLFATFHISWRPGIQH